MQSAGIGTDDSKVRPGRGADKNQSNKSSLPALLEYKLAPMWESSSSSTPLTSGSHSKTVFGSKSSGTSVKALDWLTFEFCKA
jgi:hypothetical protein